MAIVSQHERKQVMAEHAYWKELADLVGWRIHGWSGKYSCSYWTAFDKIPSNPLAQAVAGIRHDNYSHNLIEVSGEQREQLVTAIRKGGR